MTDIELVVKIDADVYTRLFDNGIQDNEIATDDICEMARALRLGKPLPKGHWSLIDRKELLYAPYKNGGFVEWYHVIKYAPAIIEADKEIEE